MARIKIEPSPIVSNGVRITLDTGNRKDGKSQTVVDTAEATVVVLDSTKPVRLLGSGETTARVVDRHGGSWLVP